MGKLTISPVPANLIELIFPMARPMLDRVVEKAPNDISIESIKRKLMNAETLMIAISDGPDMVAVNIMESCEYETGYKVMFIPIVGGDRMDEWLDDFMNIAHAIAIDYGCKELRGMARKGWIRVLKTHGWDIEHTVIKCMVKSREELGMK